MSIIAENFDWLTIIFIALIIIRTDLYKQELFVKNQRAATVTFEEENGTELYTTNIWLVGIEC